MAYLKLPNRSVNIFHHVDGKILCQNCCLIDPKIRKLHKDKKLKTRSDAMEHLKKHIALLKVDLDLYKLAINNLRFEKSKKGDVPNRIVLKKSTQRRKTS